jgi:hypothetical protein
VTARTQASQPGRHRHRADGSAFGSSSEAALMSLLSRMRTWHAWGTLVHRPRRHGPTERATPRLAASSHVAAAPGARPIVAGHTPHRSGLHQANRSMFAAVWSVGMHARAALTCHLSPIRPGCVAAVYDISSNRIKLASYSEQSSGSHYMRGLDGNRFHNGIGRYLGIGKRAVMRRLADRDRSSAWGSLALWSYTATTVVGTWGPCHRLIHSPPCLWSDERG